MAALLFDVDREPQRKVRVSSQAWSIGARAHPRACLWLISDLGEDVESSYGLDDCANERPL
jgi:hypothetical protein